MTESQQRRIRDARARAAIRAWRYRQRKHAGGVWYRWRRVLAEAREAYAIDADDVQRLLAQGLEPEPVGLELEPPKRVVFVAEELVSTLRSRRSIPIALGPEMLGAENVALVRFEEVSPLIERS